MIPRQIATSRCVKMVDAGSPFLLPEEPSRPGIVPYLCIQRVRMCRDVDTAGAWACVEFLPSSGSREHTRASAAACARSIP